MRGLLALNVPMDHPLPSFRQPPVVETALSVQFQPFKGFGNAHLGLFWQLVRDEYPERQDAESIEPQIERFGPGIPRARFPQFRVAAAHPAARLRMSSADGHTMVQLQNGRLVYNWRRLEGGEYPRWHVVEPGFQAELARLGGFFEAEGLGTIEPNQWEVTYVNHLVQGREWQEHADWPQLLPGLIGSVGSVSAGTFESLGCNTRFILPGEAGRLHIELNHGFAGPDEEAPELLVLQLTARGGIDEERDLAAGLALGRESIVRSFAEVTGEEAHRIWEVES